MNDMTQNYPPGTVAVATVRGVPNVRVMLRAAGGWRSDVDVHGVTWHDDHYVTDIRRQVVLNLDHIGNTHDDAEQIVRNLIATGSGVATDIANAITEQIRPPKPAEPTGLGAVVVDAEGEWWVQFSSKTGNWWRNHQGRNFRWSELDAVRVLSEGVQ